MKRRSVLSAAVEPMPPQRGDERLHDVDDDGGGCSGGGCSGKDGDCFGWVKMM